MAPNRVWLADITDIATDADWLYLAVVWDVDSRAVVGWAMAEQISRVILAGVADSGTTQTA